MKKTDIIYLAKSTVNSYDFTIYSSDVTFLDEWFDCELIERTEKRYFVESTFTNISYWFYNISEAITFYDSLKEDLYLSLHRN